MTIRNLTLMFFIAFAACTGSKVEQKNSAGKEIDQQLLQGAWFGEEYDEHAVFYIKDDSINYIEHFEKYRYGFSADTMDILLPGSNEKEFIILKLTIDSLVLKPLGSGKNEIERYWRQ